MMKETACAQCGKDGCGTDATSMVASWEEKGAGLVCGVDCCSPVRPARLL
jgi:hypothetical protein